MPDAETGEPIPVSHMIPRSREDLARRGKALRKVAEYSVGLMGRTPDYMNVTYAGFAGDPANGAANGNEAGAERLVAYQKFLRRGDISLTHTIVQPTVDKAMGDAPSGGQPLCACARSPTPSTASSCAARACWPPWRRSPTRSRSIPRCRCPPAPTPMRCPSASPWARPGLKFLCRDSVSASSNRFDHPLSSRFDEQDAFVIFDDVEIPRDRLFIDCNLAAYNSVMTHELAGQHPAADHDPRLGEARLRLGPGAAHGGRHQRRRSRDHAHDRRDLELFGVHARGRRRRRGRGARMAGRHVDAGRRAAACAARDAAAVVPAGERDPAPDRLAQRLRHADRRADGRQGPAAA